MTAPATPFEDNGGTAWTTTTEETAFLQQLATRPDVVWSEAGQSVQGLTINRLDLGNPAGNTHVVVTGQHGNEVASREGVLMFARDLAHTDDPALADYLAAHRVTIVTPMNPDYLGVRRANHNGQDLNRDHISLSQPESRVLAAVIRQTDPHIVSDHHGRDDLTGPVDWEGLGTSVAAAHPQIRALAAGLSAHVQEALTAEGYSARTYPIDRRPYLTQAAGLHHAVGLVGESWGPLDYSGRAEAVRETCHAITRWHAANSDALAIAHRASKYAARTNQQPYVLQVGDYLTAVTDIVLDPPPAGYDLTEPLPAHLIDGWGIKVNGSHVSMYQDAAHVIPLLLDPESGDREVVATRVPGPPTPPLPVPPTPGGVGLADGYRLRLDGKTYDATEILVRQGPATYRAWP